MQETFNTQKAEIRNSFDQQAATTETLAQLLERINLMESNFQVKNYLNIFFDPRSNFS